MSVEWDTRGNAEIKSSDRGGSDSRIYIGAWNGLVEIEVDDGDLAYIYPTPDEARAIADRLYKLADEIDAEKES